MKKNVFAGMILVVLAATFLIGCDSPQQISKAEQDKDIFADSLIVAHKDSLLTYFGSFEIRLLEKYKWNHENLSTEKDFYEFYRNTLTLKEVLEQSLNRDAKKILAEGNPLPSLSWFNTIAKGLEIYRINHNTGYEVVLDYEDFEAHANATKGEADDEFIKLLHTIYYEHSNTPRWMKKDSGDDNCNELGNNHLHLKVFKQIDIALSHNTLFSKEIHKIKMETLKSILFEQTYCASASQVAKEINAIINEVDLTDKEKNILAVRLSQLNEPGKFKVKFDCENRDCSTVSL